MIYGIAFARCTIWMLLPLVASVRFGMDLGMIIGAVAVVWVQTPLRPITTTCAQARA